MSATEPVTEPLTREEMLSAIKKQVEYYFSKENLSNDPHLVSQMNESYYVPLAVILNFPKIQHLTTKMEDLLEAIKDSETVLLNENSTMIKPNIKLERKTVILRDIPSDVPEDEIRKLFEGLGNIESIRSDVGNTWFITLESEEVAIAAVLGLKNRTFRDQAVKARLKSENLLRTIYKPAMVPVIPPMTNVMTDTMAPVAPSPFYPPFNPVGAPYFGAIPNYFNNTTGADKSKKVSRKGHKKSGRRDDREKENIAIVLPQIQSNAHFPPLVPTGPSQEVNGYNNKPFKKYTNDEILDIVRNLENIEIPSTIEAGDHSDVLVEANTDLVEKGRTMSIDQALSHGRPRILSVDSVDYTQMVYGSEEEEVVEQVRKVRKTKKHNKPYVAAVLNGIPVESNKDTKTTKETKVNAPKENKEKSTKENSTKKDNKPKSKNTNNKKRNNGKDTKETKPKDVKKEEKKN